MTTNDVNFQLAVQGAETFRDLHSVYGQRGLNEGYQIMHEAHRRKLGSEYKEQFADLLEELKGGGKTWFNDRISWVLNSTYGSEIHYYLMNLIESAMAGKTGKRFENSLTMCAKCCITTLCLLEHDSLNISACFRIFKQIPKETNEAIIESAKQEIIEYFTSE